MSCAHRWADSEHWRRPPRADPSEAPPYLSQMDAEITLLDRLVGDLLDMARFDAGEADLRLEQLPLLPWAVDAFSRSRLRIEEQGVSVSTRLPVADMVVAMDRAATAAGAEQSGGQLAQRHPRA
jgi:signal transduction histidine kinase